MQNKILIKNKRLNSRKYIKLNCEKCGKQFERELKEHTRNLKKNRKAFCGISCAVSYSNIINPRINSYQNLIDYFKYNKHFSRKRDEYSVFRECVRRANSRIKQKPAKLSNSNLDIDYLFLKQLWDKQGGICPYSKIKMILPIDVYDRALPTTASLDRIDSSRGYCKDNVQFVCLFVNYAKNGFTDLQIKEIFDKFTGKYEYDNFDYII